MFNQMADEGIRIASSADLARRRGLNPPQIRKDLAFFGKFGVRDKIIESGIVAVPSEAAQGVVTQLVGARERGNVNFAPTPVTAPSHVTIKNVALGSELEHLSYHLSKSDEK
jgi:NADH/NAD ratio-sensing transcriptional regulator Rex